MPEADIRSYVTHELAAIKRAHHLGHTLSLDWPFPDDIDYIVNISSGQFIYAATVVRFISSSPHSPKYSLDQVKGIRPAKRNSPFTALDAVYTHILSQADDWDTLKVILSSQIISNYPFLLRAIGPLGYTADDITTHTATLSAIIKFDGKDLDFYHASMVDFLMDPTRSGNFYLDIPVLHADLAAAHLSKKVHNFTRNDLYYTLEIAGLVTVSSPALKNALVAFSPQDLPFRVENVTYCYLWFIPMLHRVYSESNEYFYEALLHKWLLYFYQCNFTANELKLGQIKLGLEIWEKVSRETALSIRCYVTDELAAIKRAHRLGHALPFDWPFSDDIDYIVWGSSGQFHFAAIVVRFLSSSSHSPKYSLDQIKAICPAKHNSPSAALNAVYMHILSLTDNWDTLKVILSSKIFSSRTFGSLLRTIEPLGYTADDITAHTASLAALMQFDGQDLEFYHSSLAAFLSNATRSGDLFLDIRVFTADLAAAHFFNKVHNDKDDLRVTLKIAYNLEVSSPALENALAAFIPQDLAFRIEILDDRNDLYYEFLKRLERLYSKSNEHFYKALLRKWLAYFYNSDYPAERLELDKIKLGLEIWEEIKREPPQSETGQSEMGQSSKKRALSPDPADLTLHTRQRARHGDHSPN